MAVPVNDAQGNTSISLVLEKRHEDQDTHLMNYLRQYLPHYMIPTRVVHLRPFPHNSNNKIDRKRIREMIAATAEK